jgi:opacity protein-like surface antigen
VATAERMLLFAIALALLLSASSAWPNSPDSAVEPEQQTGGHPVGAAAAGADDDAQDIESRSAHPGDEHRVGFGLAVGYGHGVSSRSRQRGRDVADVQLIAINPHVRMLLGQPGSGERWYHGSLDGMLEGSVLINFEPHTGYAGGVLAALRYRILPGRRLRPYVEAGIGLGRLAFDLQSQDDGFSFFLNAGAGLRWRLNDTLALTGSVRWHHISNAQTHLPNNGIDDVLFLVGLEIW